MSDSREIVTIDGPSGVGKSTISRKLAAKLGYTYLDTGAMYRTVALKCKQKNVTPANEKEVEKILEHLDMELLPPVSLDADVTVLLDGEDVSSEIRTPEISMLASQVSTLPLVRTKLTALQQKIGMKGKIVAEGRDTGTVVFPDAAHKFYLDATPEERARRRIEQLRKAGKPVDEDKIREQILQRDQNDSERTIAPMQAAPDAIVVDSTRLSAEEVVERMIAFIKKQ